MEEGGATGTSGKGQGRSRWVILQAADGDRVPCNAKVDRGPWGQGEAGWVGS